VETTKVRAVYQGMKFSLEAEIKEMLMELDAIMVV